MKLNYTALQLKEHSTLDLSGQLIGNAAKYSAETLVKNIIVKTASYLGVGEIPKLTQSAELVGKFAKETTANIVKANFMMPIMASCVSQVTKSYKPENTQSDAYTYWESTIESFAKYITDSGIKALGVQDQESIDITNELKDRLVKFAALNAVEISNLAPYVCEVAKNYAYYTLEATKSHLSYGWESAKYYGSSVTSLATYGYNVCTANFTYKIDQEISTSVDEEFEMLDIIDDQTADESKEEIEKPLNSLTYLCKASLSTLKSTKYSSIDLQ